MPETRPYYADKGLSAAFYDLTTTADPTLAGDIELYASLASGDGSVLELGAGTARVALALAERGLKVVGVDLAPSMLAQAQAKLEQADPAIAERVRLVRGDMTALKLGESFDAVICPFFALAHLPAGAAWRNVFAVTARHLKSGGLAAFHLPRAEMLGSEPPPPDRPVLRAKIDAAGRRLLIFVAERKSRPGVGRFDQLLDYVITDAKGTVLTRSRERLTYYAADPVPFAAGAGLVPDRPPIDFGGVSDVFVFRKA